MAIIWIRSAILNPITILLSYCRFSHARRQRQPQRISARFLPRDLPLILGNWGTPNSLVEDRDRSFMHRLSLIPYISTPFSQILFCVIIRLRQTFFRACQSYIWERNVEQSLPHVLRCIPDKSISLSRVSCAVWTECETCRHYKSYLKLANSWEAELLLVIMSQTLLLAMLIGLLPAITLEQDSNFVARNVHGSFWINYTLTSVGILNILTSKCKHNISKDLSRQLQSGPNPQSAQTHGSDDFCWR